MKNLWRKSVDWRSFGVCLLLVVSFTAVVATVQQYTKVVSVSWKVVPAEGIDVFPDALMFGEIQQGQTAMSSFTVTNVADVALNVTVTAPITLGTYAVYVDPNNFILEVGETQTVNVTIDTQLASPGTYTAEIWVTARS